MESDEKREMLKTVIQAKTCLLESMYKHNKDMEDVDFSTVLGSNAAAYREFKPENIKVGYIVAKNGKKLGCEVQENGTQVLRFF